MIIFELILITLKSSIVLRGSSDSSDSWLKPKIQPPSANLACPNLWNTLYMCKFTFLFSEIKTNNLFIGVVWLFKMKANIFLKVLFKLSSLILEG